MATVAIRIDMPPTGIEVTGNGSSPSDEEMAEEQSARDEFIDRVTPALSALPERPPRRTGNVSRVKLLGADTWSNLNHYLVLLEGEGAMKAELEAVLPPDAVVTELGSFSGLQEWPEPEV